MSRLPRAARLLTLLTTATALIVGLSGSALAEPLPSPAFGAAIERYNPYEGQVGCTSTPSPGVVALQELVTRAYPQYSRGSLLRACGQGGTSEHKDGRAFDWPVSARVPAQAAAAQELLTWLTAPDEYGNRDARLRRMGIMYVIWNGAIFKTYDRAPGWYPYTGASPHTDHVHFTMGWAGARQSTSWWQRTSAPSPAIAAAGTGLEVLVRSAGGSPSHRAWQPGGALGPATALGGTIVSGLSSATLADGSLLVAGRGTDDQLYLDRRAPDGRWQGWSAAGGVLTARPTVVARPGGGFDTGVRGTDGQVYLRSADADLVLQPWTAVAASLAPTSGPALAYVGDRLELVVGWTDDSIRRRSRLGSTWGAWSSLGGQTRGDVAASAEGGALVLAVRGTDAGGWVRTLGATDSGWQSVGGILSSPPSLASAPDGSVSHIVVQGTDARLYRAKHDASGWTSWVPLA